MSEDFENLASTVKGLYFGANWVSGVNFVVKSLCIGRNTLLYHHCIIYPNFYRFHQVFLLSLIIDVLNEESKAFRNSEIDNNSY